MYRARDIMHRDVVTVHPEESVEEAMRKLVDHNVSGAPVVGEDGELVGVISEFPLLEAIYSPGVTRHQVREFMSKDVVTVRENTLLSDIASLFVLNRIRRVPVVRDNRVVGIVSRRDLLRYILDSGETHDEFLKDVCGAVGG